jgi:hypothetical protein
MLLQNAKLQYVSILPTPDLSISQEARLKNTQIVVDGNKEKIAALNTKMGNHAQKVTELAAEIKLNAEKAKKLREENKEAEALIVEALMGKQNAELSQNESAALAAQIDVAALEAQSVTMAAAAQEGRYIPGKTISFEHPLLEYGIIPRS